MSVDAVPALVRRLYAVVRELEELFPGQKFTPDGHLVGSLGEVLAAHDYGLELLPNSTESHDARTPRGDLVQIKATQGRAVALRAAPQFLLVLKLDPDGTHHEVYNGPGGPVWDRCGTRQKNGQRSIGFKRLLEIQDTVPRADRLPSVLTT